MGAEANPGHYGLAHTPAKVYRKTFAQQKDNLVFQEHKQEKLPRWLAGKSYLDVTDAYADLCVTITVDLGQSVPDSVDIAYLCVFNSGEWKPIHWARIHGGRAVFDRMGGNLLYLPALYLDEKVVPHGAPLVPRSDLDYQRFICRAGETITLRAASTTSRKQVASTDGVVESHLKPGVEYELFYWHESWQSLGKATAGTEPLVFEHIPAGCLYRLVGDNGDGEERPFSVEAGRQVWW
jgi:hypothetical protein